MIARRAMVAYHQAVELQKLAEFAHLNEDDEFAYLEVATQLRISDRAAQHRLRYARELTDRLPRTLEALWDGQIEEYKAKLIAEATITCLMNTPLSLRNVCCPGHPSRPPGSCGPR